MLKISLNNWSSKTYKHTKALSSDYRAEHLIQHQRRNLKELQEFNNCMKTSQTLSAVGCFIRQSNSSFNVLILTRVVMFSWTDPSVLLSEPNRSATV